LYFFYRIYPPPPPPPPPSSTSESKNMWQEHNPFSHMNGKNCLLPLFFFFSSPYSFLNEPTRCFFIRECVFFLFLFFFFSNALFFFFHFAWDSASVRLLLKSHFPIRTLLPLFLRRAGRHGVELGFFFFLFPRGRPKAKIRKCILTCYGVPGGGLPFFWGGGPSSPPLFPSASSRRIINKPSLLNVAIRPKTHASSWSVTLIG